jgi:hypothetical protein
MSVEPNYVVDSSSGPATSAYGKVIRERGTLRLLIAAAVAAVLFYGYTVVRTYQLNQKQWPPLQHEANGLTVLGIQTKDRLGKKAPYVARSSNKSWQIRYRDADEKEANEEERSEESKDRGSNSPGAGRGTEQGGVVPMDELYKACPTVLSGAQFAHASIDEDIRPVFNDKYWKVIIDLTPEGQSRYYQYSSKREKERLAFILGDEVLACPEMAAMNTSTLTLDPIWIKADAERIANFINNQKR